MVPARARGPWSGRAPRPLADGHTGRGVVGAAGVDPRGWPLPRPPAGAHAALSSAAELQRRGEYEQAADFLEKNLARWYDGLNRSLLAWSLHLRGVVAMERDEGRAIELIDESLAVWNEIGSRWGVAMGTSALGALMRARTRSRNHSMANGAKSPGLRPRQSARATR